MYRLKLGKSVKILKEEYYDELKSMKNLGFESIDVDLCDVGFFNELYQFEEIEKRMQALKDSGLYFNAVHIPYGTQWDISVADENERKYSVENVIKTIAEMDKYAPSCYVLHGSFEPIMDKEREKKLESLIQSAKEIYAFTKTPIALENLPRTCLLNTTAEILTVAEKVEGLRICLDVNHFLRERTEKAITNVSKLIITTHISDHDYANERHWLPKEGKIDWMKLLSELEKSGYNGVFNYEVKAEYTLAQIKDNYEALFEEYNR